MSDYQSKLSQKLLRHIKCSLTFSEVELLRGLLSTVKDGLTDSEFIEVCYDLIRDMEHYSRRRSYETKQKDQ